MPPERKSLPRNRELAALGRAIEERMAEIGLSQRKLAGESGIDIRRVGDYVRGQHSPNYTNMKRLCEALGLKLDELLERAERVQKAPHTAGSQDAGARRGQ
jgi:transcriptional regulator with XRE-family HTH domain